MMLPTSGSSSGLLHVSILLLAVLSGAARVRAQAPRDDPRATARVHVGPFYVTPTVGITNLGVDTNVFNQPDNPKSDFTVTFVPRAVVAVPIASRALLKTDASVDLVYFQTFASERSVDPQVRVRGELYLNRITLFAEDAFLHTRQRPNFEIDSRSRRTENTLTAGADVRVLPKLFIQVSGRRSLLRYDASAVYEDVRLQETLNRNTSGMAAALRYAATPKTTFVLRAGAQRDRFIFSPDRDSDSVRIEPGVEFGQRALIAGNAYVGVRHFKTLAAQLANFDGVVASGSLSYTLLGATRFTVFFSRDLDYSYERLQPFYVSNGVGGNVRRQLGGRFDVIAGAQRYRYNYTSLLVTPVVFERRDDTSNYWGNVGYRLTGGSRLGLQVSYWQRTSSALVGREYKGVRAGITFTQVVSQ